MSRHGRIIYMIGDLHGEFGWLNRFINSEIRQSRSLKSIFEIWADDGNDLQVNIFQCGDFGYFWPGYDSKGVIRNNIDFLPGGRVPIHWVGGNHEDWDRLDELGTEIAEIDPGVFFCPFGSTLEISPEITVLFAGGAESADKEWRLAEMRKGQYGKIWCDQEGVSDADIARLHSVRKADWVVSHTAPYDFDLPLRKTGLWGTPVHLNEPSRKQLENVLLMYDPKKWFFGHFHLHATGHSFGCDWECLNMVNGGSGKCVEKIYLEWDG